MKWAWKQPSKKESVKAR